MSAEKSVKRCVIITGLSGAGKTTALDALEDCGFYAVDNVPPSMLPQLVGVLSANGAAVTTGVAAVVDVRGGDLLDGIFRSVDELKEALPDVKVVFLDSSGEQIVRRFETTRRRHPLGDGSPILKSVAEEGERLLGIRSMADIVIDTSSLSPNGLREKLLSELGEDCMPQTVVVSSFGFKNGVPADCDYMFDVRFLPNPNYVPELKGLSGKDPKIRAYLDRAHEKRAFMDELARLVAFVADLYPQAVKKQLHIAIGCTGGRHRSVAIAEEIAAYLAGIGHPVSVCHRDINLESR
ncbi:MAG: RNase adapter RapZ [Synergistaceae bacterium]|jgi:UPF0042 nucleotide-binding protein|nr:RNase adapter RapZ [Synergistaceae bacterium]